MGKTRQQTRTQSSSKNIIEKTQKIKKHQRKNIIKAPWNKIKLNDQNEFHYELPTKINLEDHKGSYLLIENIQDGGQGVIFKAQKILQNQKIYALKLFKHKPNKKYLESIEKSVPKNINLLQYYDVGYYKDHLVNVTQLCESDLYKEIYENHQQDKSIMEREIVAIDIIKQILNGYFTLLNYGIIHRDLKPENILIKDGVYKISDFGFAIYTVGTQKTKVGTNGYQSPQVQMSNKSKKLYTSKCDIYSLGIIFYEIIFRKLPFPKNSNMKGIQVITFPDNSISQEAKEFILKCTEIQEENRLSWIEVYNHKIFKEFFKNIVKQLEMIDELNQLKQSIFENITENQTQQLKSLKQVRLIDFLQCFHNSHFTRRQQIVNKKPFKKMYISFVFCMLLQDRKYITGNEILENQKTKFSRVRMAQNGHVACLLTIYTQLIYFPDDFQFFNKEEITFNQYHKFLKDIDPTIDKKNVEYSFDILQEQGLIKTNDMNELFQFKFLENESQST